MQKFSLILIVLLVSASPAMATWADASYKYATFIHPSDGFRPAVIESNWSNTTGTNNLTHVYFNGQSGINFGQVKIFLNNVTVLSRCLNGTTNHTDINMTGNGTIGIYYGSGTDNNFNDCEGTYRVYDTFSGSSINTSNWTTAGAPTVSGGIATMGGNTVQISSKNNITSTSTYPAIMVAKASRTSTAFLALIDTNPPNTCQNLLTCSPGSFESAGIEPGFLDSNVNDGTNSIANANVFPVGFTLYKFSWVTSTDINDIQNGSYVQSSTTLIPDTKYLHPAFASFNGAGTIINVDYTYGYTQLIDSATWGNQILNTPTTRLRIYNYTIG